MWDLIAQIGVFSFGIIGIFLVARKNKWGFVFGLIAQPFWLITSYIHEQWGVFFVTIIYAINWFYGIYVWFYKKESSPTQPVFPDCTKPPILPKNL
jgi:nicotinamide riboside transporter PnuC